MSPQPSSQAVSIRAPKTADLGAMAMLLGELGYAISHDRLAANLAGFEATGSDAVFVAEAEGVLLGVLALHWAMMLHFEAPVARITTLVIKQGERGRGVGRLLVEQAKNSARQAGCRTLELTTRTRRADAQAFYQRLGFEADSIRLSIKLE